MFRITVFCFFAFLNTPAFAQARLELDYTIGQNVGSGSFGFAQIDDKVYFSADDGFHGIELYSYDLATQKTSLIEDFTPGGGSTNPTNLVVSDGALFFNGSLYDCFYGGDQILTYEPAQDTLYTVIKADSIIQSPICIVSDIVLDKKILFRSNHPVFYTNQYFSAVHIYDLLTKESFPIVNRQSGQMWAFEPNFLISQLGSDLYFFCPILSGSSFKTLVYKCNAADGLLDFESELPGRVTTTKVVNGQLYVLSEKGFFEKASSGTGFTPSARFFLLDSELFNNSLIDFLFIA